MRKSYSAWLISFVLLFSGSPAFAQHGWPVEATNSDHPLGNSFGEFQDYGGVYKHTGIDILVTPRLNADGTVNASAPQIRATVGGTISQLSDVASTMYNGTTIQGTDGTTYRYWHLENGSYDATYVTNFNNGTAISANDQIAQIVRWVCDYHHLHYDLSSGGNYLNPLADITPKSDAVAPQIDGIFFAQDNSNPWVQLNPVNAGGCTVVSGNVDIIAKIRDTDDAGSTLVGADTLWVRNLRWRACPETNANCAWQDTHDFSSMPTGWGTGGNASTTAYFSNRAPWDSDSDYCKATWNYGVVTNFSGGSPNATGNWTTTGIPDGVYTVSVEATDFTGNKTTASTRACVQNTGGCATDLTIRDASDDTGAIPYLNYPWWLSPDITANPGTVNEDKNIVLNSANPIEVRAWNYGSCSLPAGATYQVCLAWDLPSGTVTNPVPQAQIIGCQNETVQAGGWAVGTNRTTTFSWTPSDATIPAGHHCLIAWVDTAQDPVQNAAAINWDDNAAQQNIEFVSPPAPGTSAYGSFWINPQKTISNRNIEVHFKQGKREAAAREIRLHIPPGVTIKRVVGGSIIGGYKGDKPTDPCDNKDRCGNGACTSWEKAAEQGCTLVIGGIDPEGRLRLEGVHVSERRKINVEALFEREDKKERFTRVDVMEYGVLRGHKTESSVGGMTIIFE